MQDRRSEIRMMCADVIEASWRDRQGRRRRSTALLEDISRSGACLQLERPVPLGAMLALRCHSRELVGVVRYCVFREIGYFVGVEFGAGCEWSERQFKPQHLLNLQKLLEHKPRRVN
jgi:hypothetical protein